MKLFKSNWVSSCTLVLLLLLFNVSAWAYISVNPSTITFSGAGGKKKVSVSHSGGWHYGSPVEDWIFCSQNGNQLTIDCYKNYDDTVRTARITLESGNSQCVLTIVQQIPEPDIDTTDRRKTLDFAVKGVKFKMIYVEGGAFTMGASFTQSAYASELEYPAHRVELSEYHIGETEVTQELWQAVMGYNQSSIKGANLPVDNISYTECVKFVDKLNSLTNEQFVIPTEAEWEFAARGGNYHTASIFSGSMDITAIGWFFGNAKGVLQKVKTKKPNSLKIYDMSGNVWEWCSDYLDIYSAESQYNPKGPSSGYYRVFRGGACDEIFQRCRVTVRGGANPQSKKSNVGLRLVLHSTFSDVIVNE